MPLLAFLFLETFTESSETKVEDRALGLSGVIRTSAAAVRLLEEEETPCVDSNTFCADILSRPDLEMEKLDTGNNKTNTDLLVITL